jgi:phosphoserine phosphatase RsbU/P
MGVLLVDRGERQGEIINLALEKTVLGRHPDFCDEIISKNEAVSRRHAQIVRVNDRHYLEDLKSRNHTYLNDAEMAPYTQAQLFHKDVIRICEFTAVYLDQMPEGAADDNSSTVEAILSSSGDHGLEKQPAAKLAALLEITARLSKTLQLDTQLPEVIAGLLTLFPQADRCFIILQDEESRALKPKFVRTRRGDDEGTANFSHTIVRQCLRTSQAILLWEGGGMPIPQSSTDSVVTFNIRSVMCVPLFSAAGEPFGVIQLDTQDADKKFTEADLKLLWGVASQAAVAMENARFHQMQLAQERVKKELDMARQVQLNFLPDRVPELPGYEFYAYYEPAREVGGDYYDFIPLADQRLALALGDVAGKGMPAALLMARLSSDTRSCLISEKDPTAAIAKLNDHLHPYTSRMDRFVTMIASVLDPATHTLTLVNAGHPPPLWFRRAENTCARAIPLEDDGQSLGLTLGNRYRAYQIQLAPGDCVLLYSDGVTDAQSIGNEPFRQRGLMGLIEKGVPGSPCSLGEKIVQAVQHHAQGRTQHDDITLLCFGRPMR